MMQPLTLAEVVLISTRDPTDRDTPLSPQALHDDGLLIGLLTGLTTHTGQDNNNHNNNQDNSSGYDDLDPAVLALETQARRTVEHSALAQLANNERLDPGAYTDINGADYSANYDWMNEDHTIDTRSVLTNPDHAAQFEDWLRDASIPEVELKNALRGGVEDGRSSARHS